MGWPKNLELSTLWTCIRQLVWYNEDKEKEAKYGEGLYEQMDKP